MGLIGSLEPIERLLDSYANNSEDRKKLIISQLTSDPFDIELPKKTNKDGNDNMMFNAYLNSLGIIFKREYEENILDKINTKLSTSQVINLGKIIEIFNQFDYDVDAEDYINHIETYESLLKLGREIKEKDILELFG